MDKPGHRRLAVVAVAAVALSVGILAVGGSTAGSRARNATHITRAAAPVPTTAVTVPEPTAPSTTDTTTPPTTEAPAPVSDPGVVALQQRLAAMGYDVGTPDGVVGAHTADAMMAFQKVEGLSRTGEDSASLRAAVAGASTPGPMVPGGEANRVEVDIDRQVLFLWQGGKLTRILPVSTGSGQHYCVDGECDTAITPTGTFRIGRKFAGLEVSRLGELWSPSYFYGGIAIHGSPSVPAYPASHGCVRVPMYAAVSLFDQLPSGTAVYVVGHGPSAGTVAAPPDRPTRPSTPPSTEAPSTTAPPTTEAPATTVPDTTSTTSTTVP
ncbi:MAG: L,D-transpeptidase family protein [Acidimicrobiales bacterium]